MQENTAVDEYAARVLRHFGPDPANWVRPGATDHDVVVVGAGQAGLGIGFALRRAGIGRVAVVDAAPPGRTGAWTTIARMTELRTPKNWPEPEFGFPELGFQAWYEAVHGERAYADLPRVPRLEWAAYLEWIQRHLRVPVRHHTRLTDITPASGRLDLTFTVTRPDGAESTVRESTRKLVLANGVEGTGGPNLPAELDGLPPALLAHTGRPLDYAALSGRTVAVIGAAASAFDAAAAALEAGAAAVHLFARRYDLIVQGPGGFGGPGIGARNNYHRRGDAARWRQKVLAARAGRSVPLHSVTRATAFDGFHIHLNAPLRTARAEDGRVVLEAADGTHVVDFVIAGTGYQYDPRTRAELRSIADDIALWADRFRPDGDLTDAALARTPYLGNGFQLLEKHPGQAPWVGRIHVFSAAAHLSFGYPIGDAQSLAHAIPRLTDAVGRDLYFEDQDTPAAATSPSHESPSLRAHYAHAIWSPARPQPAR
ncbi:NAD(P)-binding domain-containing protein [Nocardia sp. alder85J]|uniref:NAD(P)-binding domain-containing protein n=1 Tax=Nocardia sp. alder85J TaxID=2862949 RepID=UPI001CD5AE70|nr:NAD(P)-binding domain-containing protein [Nocardia sp. alder85J]MCX4098544.1 NAD(P)-binding domain-containing protein [Nocardia sp. alder85J]